MPVPECMDCICIIHVTAELSFITIFCSFFHLASMSSVDSRSCIELVTASPRPVPALLEFCYPLLSLNVPELVTSDNSNFILFNQG